MAYDELLAERVRDIIAGRDGVSERRMFGGIVFLVGGNMACGVSREDLIVRLGEDDAERALAEPHARVFDRTGRPMRNWILVSPEGTREASDLAGWVELGADHAASLPPK
jgi:TfoX/Sxy family transcriptional regulator of competence genes